MDFVLLAAELENEKVRNMFERKHFKHLKKNNESRTALTTKFVETCNDFGASYSKTAGRV